MQQTVNNPYDAKNQANLLVERDQHHIIVPGLSTTCHLLLLNPIIEPLPDTIPDPIGYIGEQDRKQDEEYSPGKHKPKEYMLPGHSHNCIKQWLFLRINPPGKTTSLL